MRILYVTRQSPWPPIVGSRIRSYNIVRLLARRNEVTVALLNDSADEIARFENDHQRLPHGEVVTGAASVSPASARGRRYRSLTLERYRPAFKSDASGTYRDNLRALIEREKPDVLWFFRLDTVWNAGCDCYDTPVIADMDDFETKSQSRSIRLLPVPKRVVALSDYPFFVRALQAAARPCDLLLVSNPLDIMEAADLTGRPVRLVPNGCDYSTPPNCNRPRQPRIVFYGALGYGPNLDGLRWFLREIWPSIRKDLPDARLEVAGKLGPAAQVFANEPGVRLCGFVESIRSFAEGAALLAVPLRTGGGTRIKILEAWALGLPVVSTTVGCEGLDAVNGETVMVADDPYGFARACIDLMRSPSRGCELALRAFEFARPRFDWSALAPQIDDALASVTPHTPSCRKTGLAP